MSSKSLYTISNLIIIFLLAGCIPASPASTVLPVASSPTASISGPLSASFTQAEYRLGETLEFTIRLVNEESVPQTVSVSLRLFGDPESGLPIAEGFQPEDVSSKVEKVQLEANEQKELKYQIPFASYADIGTGDYVLIVDALNQSLRAEARVVSVFEGEVTHPNRLRVGKTIVVKAVVKNTADFDVHNLSISDVRYHLEEQTIDTLPAHTSITLTWDVHVTEEMSVFQITLLVRSADGGNTVIGGPIIPITPAPTP